MGNRLEIRGQKSNWQEAEKENRHAARQSGRFNRTVQLPVSVVPDEVDAAYKDGVLTIRLPRREDARAKRILHLSA
jgi:HSP20 family protein